VPPRFYSKSAIFFSGGFLIFGVLVGWGIGMGVSPEFKKSVPNSLRF